MKVAVIELTQMLPDDATIDVILSEVYVRQKLVNSIRDLVGILILITEYHTAKFVGEPRSG